MEIKLTLQQIAEAWPALQNLSMEKMPVKLAYNITRNRRKLAGEHQDFQKVRNEIIKQYGEERDGQHVLLPGMDGWDEGQKALDELFQTEVTVGIRPVVLADFANLSVRPADLYPLLDWMIEEGEV